jgi:hypothetical protein
MFEAAREKGLVRWGSGTRHGNLFEAFASPSLSREDK